MKLGQKKFQHSYQNENAFSLYELHFLKQKKWEAVGGKH